jgi:acetyl-CoA C-acetyltransferase
MGVSADLCATEYKITREEQDNFAIQSYERSAMLGKLENLITKIVPVAVPQRKGDLLWLPKMKNIPM